MLGLVAMATTVDNLYASMKALVCIIGDNQVALKEMERTGGFQVHMYIVNTRTIILYLRVHDKSDIFTEISSVTVKENSVCLPPLHPGSGDVAALKGSSYQQPHSSSDLHLSRDSRF